MGRGTLQTADVRLRVEQCKLVTASCCSSTAKNRIEKMKICPLRLGMVTQYRGVVTLARGGDDACQVAARFPGSCG